MLFKREQRRAHQKTLDKKKEKNQSINKSQLSTSTAASSFFFPLILALLFFRPHSSPFLFRPPPHLLYHLPSSPFLSPLFRNLPPVSQVNVCWYKTLTYWFLSPLLFSNPVYFLPLLQSTLRSFVLFFFSFCVLFVTPRYRVALLLRHTLACRSLTYPLKLLAPTRKHQIGLFMYGVKLHTRVSAILSFLKKEVW